MKAEHLLAEALERRAKLASTEAARVARYIAELQVARSICEDGRPLRAPNIMRFQGTDGRSEYTP